MPARLPLTAPTPLSQNRFSNFSIPSPGCRPPPLSCCCSSAPPVQSSAPGKLPCASSLRTSASSPASSRLRTPRLHPLRLHPFGHPRQPPVQAIKRRTRRRRLPTARHANLPELPLPQSLLPPTRPDLRLRTRLHAPPHRFSDRLIAIATCLLLSITLSLNFRSFPRLSLLRGHPELDGGSNLHCRHRLACCARYRDTVSGVSPQLFFSGLELKLPFPFHGRLRTSTLTAKLTTASSISTSSPSSANSSIQKDSGDPVANLFPKLASPSGTALDSP